MRRAGILLFATLLGCSSADGPLPAGTATFLSITPAETTLTSLGDSLKLKVVARDRGGKEIQATPAWSSNSRFVAEVRSDGTVISNALGTAAVSARMDSVSATATITIIQKTAKVVFLQQPDDITIGSFMGGPVSIEVQDARGRSLQEPQTGGLNLPATLTLHSPQAGATLSGNTTVNVYGGMAGFNNLSVRPVGAGNRLVASVAGVTDSSRTFEVVGFSTVAAGSSHTCATTTTGKTTCWGENNEGQLGDGTFERHATAGFQTGTQTLSPLALGSGHSCGLSPGGAAFCWGTNASGQLGDNSTTSHNTPTAVAGGITFASITAGFDHTCGLTAAGVAYCWGRNEVGAIGDYTVDNRKVPTAVYGNLTFTALDAANFGTCGLSGGKIYCWGGITSSITQTYIPTELPGGLTFEQLAVGANHVCGITTNHDAWCWGMYLSDTYDGTSSNPGMVGGGFTFSTIVAGGGLTCGRTLAGPTYCWGRSFAGSIGNPSYEYGSSTPVLLLGGDALIQLTAGEYHTCGRTLEGALACWGWNAVGELGNGGGGDRSVPAIVIWKRAS